MKYFRGSISVIFLFFSIAFCSILFASVLNELNTGISFEDKFISDQTMCVRIVSKGQDNKFTYGHIAEFIEQHPNITIFRTNYFDHSLEIYTQNVDALSKHYSIINGSDFTSEQFISGEHNLLISNNVRFFTHDNDGISVYNHRNREYTVFGLISSSEFDCIAPIYTALRDECDNPVSDMLYINAGGNTQAVVNELGNLILSIDKQTEISINSENSDFGSSEINRPAIIVSILIALVTVIILCMSSVTDYWTYTRKKELFVRLLSGADHITAIKKIIFDFLVISALAVLIGAVFAVISSKIGLFGLNATGLNALHIASVAVMTLSIGLGAAQVYLRFQKMCDESICQLRR